MILRHWFGRLAAAVGSRSSRTHGWHCSRAVLCGTAVAAMLAACASAPATRFYVLNSVVRDGSALSTNGLAVVIRDVRLPQYLERPQLVTRGSDHRVQIAEEAQWAGNLQQDMVRVLTENLGQLLKSERVFSAPHNGPLKPDFRIDVEILRFERGADRRVVLSARWWLVGSENNVLLEAPSTVLYGQVLEERDVEGLVASMSDVYAQFAQQIAKSILSRGRSPS